MFAVCSENGTRYIHHLGLWEVSIKVIRLDVSRRGIDCSCSATKSKDSPFSKSERNRRVERLRNSRADWKAKREPVHRKRARATRNIRLIEPNVAHASMRP